MASGSDLSVARTASPARVINIYQIVALVLPWNTTFKASRVLNTLFALELGATPWQTGVLLAMYGLFPMLIAAHAGRIADRHGVRLPLYAGLTLLTLGVALPFFVPTFIAIFISAAVGGAGFILSQVSMQALTGSLGDGEARTRNFSYYLLAVASADFAGPVLAGFCIDAFGHVPTYAIIVAPTLLAFAGFAAMDRLLPRSHGEVRQGVVRMRELFREHDLRRVLITSAVTMTAADLFQLYVPLYSHAIGLSASVIGLVMGAAAAAVLVTRALLPPMARVVGEERLLLLSLLLTAAMFALIPLFQSAPALGAICFVLGLGMGLGQPLTMIIAYNRSPAGRAGEVVGVRVAINSVTHVVIPPIFGAIGSLAGLVPVLWACAGVLVLGAFAGRVPVREPASLQEVPRT